MNLRVDLILDTERRSGSVVSGKGVLRIVSVLVPVLFVGYLAIQFLWAGQLRQDLESRRESLESIKPQQERAKALTTEFKSHRDIDVELSGWTKSRVDWSDQLRGIMAVVPANIQLNDLRVSHSLQLSKTDKPARLFTVSLRGKAVGEDAESAVKRLESDLKGAPAFTALVESVSISQFGADLAPDAKRDDRVFQMASQYGQREFP